MIQSEDRSEIASMAPEKPSQAEGERDVADTPQEDMGKAQITEKPSQAEGDRETIDEDIEEKSATGDI